MLSGAIACIGFTWVGFAIGRCSNVIRTTFVPLIIYNVLSFFLSFLFLQMASPACTELEVIMLDWLGQMLDLPKEFLACSGGKGGGVIQV